MELDSSPKQWNSRPPLTLLKILLLNAVVCGVEICACAAFTYIPPLLLKAGYKEEEMSVIIALGPLCGLIFTPIIGPASDKCRSPYGRRRPFIFLLSALLVVSLYIIPFGEYFASLVLGLTPFTHRIGVWCLTVGSIILDFMSQACLTPCEALLNDVSKHTGQEERVFTVYSQMISLGGIIGYLLTAIDWNNNAVGDYFGSQEASVFSLLIVIFTVLLACTLVTADEKPLVEIEAEEQLMVSALPTSASPVKNGIFNAESGYETNSTSSLDDIQSGIISSRQTSPMHSISAPPNLVRLCTAKLERFLVTYFPIGRTFIRQLCQLIRCIRLLIYSLLPKKLQEFFQVPIVLQGLTLAHFFCWTGVMGFNLYFSDFMAQVVYQGDPNAPEGSPAGKRFDEGVRMGSWGLFFHCLASTVYAWLLERLTARFGVKTMYTFGMMSFVVAMVGMVVVRNAAFVNLMATSTGIAYATLTTIPYNLVSMYHDNKQLYYWDLVVNEGPERGIGSDLAVLDSAYFLAEVVLCFGMGYIVHLTGTVTSYMAAAAAAGVAAIFFVTQVVTNPSNLPPKLSENLPPAVHIS